MTGINRVNGHGQAVGRIVGLDFLADAEETHGHVDDLVLRRPAITGDALLDLERRKFQDRDARLLGRQEDDAPRLADGDGRRDVAVEKELLDADDVGLIFTIEFIEAVEEHDQPFCIGMVRCRLDSPIGHGLQAAAVGIDDGNGVIERRSGTTPKPQIAVPGSIPIARIFSASLYTLHNRNK